MCSDFPNSTIEEAEALDEASQVTCWRSHCQQWLRLEFEPKWSGSLLMFFNLFTLSSWGPDNFEGGCAAAYTNIFCDLLLGLVKKIAPSVLSLAPRISFMLFLCLDNSPPTLHWATSYSSFKSELTSHLGRLIPWSSIIVPCHMLLGLTEFCSSQSALITVEDYLWSASPQLTVNSLKAESMSAFLSREAPNPHSTGVWGP